VNDLAQSRQLQTPDVQTWPAAHGPDAPHRHWPSLRHVSPAPPAVQSTHAWPIVPQVVGACVVHTFPAQQPVGHDVASQTHAPLTHRWPDAHIGPVPQWQLPAVHASAPVPHDTHASPDAPHAMLVAGETHVVPEQHPLAHDDGVHPLHTPPEHVPPLHDVQAAPPIPHAVALVPGMHVLPAQHPEGHDVGSQTQAPPTQR
jgi:hypothetical protein